MIKVPKNENSKGKECFFFNACALHSSEGRDFLEAVRKKLSTGRCH
jgi:hypothetical protein